MSSYLITSREGLYHFDSPARAFTMLRKGYFFGLSKHGSVWYIGGFVGVSERERTRPTFNGYIASFRLEFGQYGLQVTEWKSLHHGLDNGAHQIKVYKGKLYVIETYIQTIKVFDINDDYTLTLAKSITLYDKEKPVANAHYILQGYGDGRYTCHGYKHINALTFHDNLVYLSCPSLRNNISPDGTPTQSLSPHRIEVYDMEFNFLWSFVIHSEVFCHDIVFQGHKCYFGAPPNKLCSLDIVSRQHEVSTVFDVKSMHPRGLSIDNIGTTVVGLRDPNMLVITNVKQPCRVEYVHAPCSPCFIAKLDYDNDFNNCMSSLVHPFVHQLSIDKLPIETKHLSSMAKCILEHEWNMYFDNRRNDKYNGANKNMQPSPTQHTLQEVKTPSESCFANICSLQTLVNQKIHCTELVVEDEMQDAYMDMLSSFNMFIKHMQGKALIVTGKLYLYPTKSGMGWHTNLEDSCNIDTIRCYIVYTSRDNNSFFLYRHPISHQIHAIPDRNGYANIFDLGRPESPLWHAVYNNSEDTQRLSIGLACHKYRMGAFHVLKDMINDICH